MTDSVSGHPSSPPTPSPNPLSSATSSKSSQKPAKKRESNSASTSAPGTAITRLTEPTSTTTRLSACSRKSSATMEISSKSGLTEPTAKAPTARSKSTTGRATSTPFAVSNLMPSSSPTPGPTSVGSETKPGSPPPQAGRPSTGAATHQEPHFQRSLAQVIPTAPTGCPASAMSASAQAGSGVNLKTRRSKLQLISKISSTNPLATDPLSS